MHVHMSQTSIFQRTHGRYCTLFSVHSIVNVISLIDVMYMNSVNAYVREKMSCFIVRS